MDDIKSLKMLVESIEDMYNDDEGDVGSSSTEVLASAPDLVRDIIDSLKLLTTKLADDSIENIEAVTSDLRNISDSLKELVSPEEIEEQHGTEDMGPSVSDDCMQSYNEPSGDSFPERKGFVG